MFINSPYTILLYVSSTTKGFAPLDSPQLCWFRGAVMLVRLPLAVDNAFSKSSVNFQEKTHIPGSNYIKNLVPYSNCWLEHRYLN